MKNPEVGSVSELVEALYRAESRRIFATLVRVLNNFDLAEEALQEAFAAAVETWSKSGVPDNPSSWLITAGRNQGIDILRRNGRFHELQPDILSHREQVVRANSQLESDIKDDRLRLIFTCCHPAIDPSIQIVLTLREVCGLTTDEIARAFLVAPSTMAQRIVRGKAKIRDAGIPYVIPAAEDLPERLESVLTVVYLVFTEGYSASSGESIARRDLTEEAIRLGRLMAELLPHAETSGLLALMLLQESRRQARSTPTGDIILLDEQDRSLWNRAMISEGLDLLKVVMEQGQVGFYGIQAAIAGEHAIAPSASATNWAQIVTFYDVLLAENPSPVVRLNRAVAIAMRDGPAAGLEEIDAVLERHNLKGYHRAHAARGHLLSLLGKKAESRQAYTLALEHAEQLPERRFLQRRLDELE